MSQSYSFKSLPNSLPEWVRPMFFASLGLHLLILFTPLQGEKKAEAPKPKDEVVKVTQLAPSPRTPVTKASSTKILPKPLPKPISSLARPRSIIPSTTKQTSPATQSSPAASPASTAPSSPTTQPTTEQSTTDPFADFPRYPGAQTGSFGLFPETLNQASFQTSADIKTVEAFFNTELPKKSFNAALSSDQGAIKVYQVMKGDSKPQFLHLITQPGKGTVMLLAPQVLNLNDLKNLSVEVETPEKRELLDVFTNLENELTLVAINPNSSDPNKDGEQLLEPDKFASGAGNSQLEYEGGRVKASVADPRAMTPAELSPILQDQLGAVGFSMEPVGEYGGGPLYRVAKGNFTRYLNLPLTKSGEAALYLWKDQPQ